jgi:hypothetical protein
MKHDADRIYRYTVRDEEIGSHNKIYEHLFCVGCKSKECNDVTHNRIELHPIIRIPKQHTNKKKWKQFFELVEYFSKDNSRTVRHSSNRNFYLEH